MNLLCPNCQRMLTVPDQSAGQLLKCPLCTSTFAAPGLPQTPLPPPIPSAGDPVPGSAAPPSASAADLYTRSPESNPPRGDPPPPPDASHAFREAPPSPSPVLPPAGYGHTFSVWLSPHVLPWISAGAMVLVFVLSFFPWIGLHPLGTTLFTQNAWQAAFNGHWVDQAQVTELQASTPAKPQGMRDTYYSTALSVASDPNAPGNNPLLILYLFFLVVTLLLTVAAAAVPVLPAHVNLPGSVRPLLPYRWRLAVALMTCALLLLVLQLVNGFSLDYKMGETGLSGASVYRTGWLTLAVLLQLVAVLGGALVMWLEHRGARPLPRFEFHW